MVAIGKPNYVKGEWFKEGAIAIDVGINSIEEEGKDGKSRKKIVGDIDFDSAI